MVSGTATEEAGTTTTAPRVGTEALAQVEDARPLRIGELAERSGRTVRTLHFYEELGLLEPSSRTKGGFRLYDKYAMLRIHWITRLQDLGFSLPDIKTFLDGMHQRNPDAPAMMSELRDFYRTKLQETRAQIQRLQTLETELDSSLSYLESCRSCAPSTGKHVCRACPEESHHGQEPPPLVAAVHLSPQD
ncbi:MAG TPA: MerR family transcriptional regulator [Myxococcota bacterium]|nr:MerR family transcriptional regulator [Myxococcota bacterium]HND29338.1 MerR family transcriptional regulator [Myxococcota bacterium]HNH47707.1 MerR family transcriptional regulator [Myxococcota bacterium]